MTESHDAKSPTASVFIRATGQADNIGDSILRRGLINALRPLGTPHLLLRSLPQDYIDGLRLSGDEVLYQDESRWLEEVKASASSQRVHFAFNAGEIQFNRFYALQYLRYMRAARVAQRSGGLAVQLGVGAREPRTKWLTLFRWVTKRLDSVGWREPRSAEATGVGFVMPDWAWSEGSERTQLEAQKRTMIVVSMRGDRPTPSDKWFAHVRALAGTEGLDIVITSQVERDDIRSAELATRLGAKLSVRSETSHSEREDAVRDLYRKASFVVSDRLHALILGATEGAIPIGLVDGGSGKISRHFAAVSMNQVEFDSLGPSFDAWNSSRATTASIRGEMLTQLEATRRLLREVTADLLLATEGAEK